MMAQSNFNRNDFLNFIPDKWDLLKASDLFLFRKGLSITKDDLVDNGVPVVSYGQIHSKTNKGTGLCDSLFRFIPEDYLRKMPECIVHKGDFIFADTSEDYAGIGNCAYVDDNIQLFAGYHTIIAHLKRCNVYPKYFAYLFQTDFWRDQIRSLVMGIKVFSVTQRYLKDTYIVLPPLNDQKNISDFLDTQCCKIDEIIVDIEKQIITLQDYKKSLITEVVTKGLNPNVPMKDSGVKWIGKIPKHWSVKRLKYCSEVKTGPFGTQLSADDYTEEGTPIINVKNIGYGTIKEEELDRIPEKVKCRISVHILNKGDIVFGRKGAVDKHAIINVEHDGWVQGSDCMRIRIREGIIPDFLNYFFSAVGYGEYVFVNSVGSTMASVNSEILNNSSIAFPGCGEQLCIVQYLNKITRQIEDTLTEKKKQVEHMNKYKQSLIYEYVTGKKLVQGV